MQAPVFIPGCQLLKKIHIPKLEIIMRVDMIIEPEEKPVLIEIIINDLFAKIDMHFIIHYKR